MNGRSITTTDTGLTLNIPWKVWLARIGLSRRRKELTEKEALEIFREGEREEVCRGGDGDAADQIRQKILAQGYTVEDTPKGPKIGEA